MEAAFQQTYGLDLRQLLYGPEPIGARRFLALVQGLPPQGPLHRSMDPEAWYWDAEHELLAILIDSTWFQTNLLWRANFKGEPPKVDRVRRPGEPDELPEPKPEPATPEQIARFFGSALKTPSKTKE